MHELRKLKLKASDNTVFLPPVYSAIEHLGACTLRANNKSGAYVAKTTTGLTDIVQVSTAAWQKLTDGALVSSAILKGLKPEAINIA